MHKDVQHSVVYKGKTTAKYPTLACYIHLIQESEVNESEIYKEFVIM